MPVPWTSDREALLDLLRENHQDMAEFYVQAIQALSHEQLIQPHLMVASHCVRELCNNLPRVLGDPVSERSDVNRPALELFRAWSTAGLAFIGTDDEDDETLRPVPTDVFRSARAVAAAANVGNQNARELTALLATGQIGDLKNPGLSRLHTAIEFFRRWAHTRDYSKPVRVLPNWQQVELELRIIEEALLTRLGNMADRAQAMRGYIAMANRRTTGGSP